jgi:hypothetical protein
MRKQNYRCQINYGAGLLTWKIELKATTAADAAKACLAKEGFSPDYQLITPGQNRGYNHDDLTGRPIPVFRFTAIKPMDSAVHIWIEDLD